MRILDDWSFLNMVSPPIFEPRLTDDGLLALPELSKWNEGSCLISRCALGTQSTVTAVFTGWDQEDSGCAVGFYAGRGGFTDYVYLGVTESEAFIRVDSGAQHGAAFMDQGQPTWLTLAACPWKKVLPVTLALCRDGDMLTASVNGQVLLSVHAPVLPEVTRGLVKALPWRERMEACHALLREAAVTGALPNVLLRGTVTDPSGRAIPYAGVHLAFEEAMVTRCDAQGRFTLTQVAQGQHMLIASAEGVGFVSCPLTLSADAFVTVVLAEEAMPRAEYNDPAFDRSENGWLPLNGVWQFAFDKEGKGKSEYWYEPDAPRYPRNIRVPFSWASLMGLGEEALVDGDALLQHDPITANFHITGEFGWYRRTFTVPEDFAGRHTILCIGACSNVTCLWLDGRYIDMRVDEYSTLRFDLGRLVPGSSHQLVIRAQYPHHIPSHNMGKQIFWFASAPGIWQSVWVEARSEAWLKTVSLRPEVAFAQGSVKAAFAVTLQAHGGDAVRLTLTDPQGDLVSTTVASLTEGKANCTIPVASPQLWDVGQGLLYHVRAELMQDGTVCDIVSSYGGLRKVETRWLPGHSPRDTDDPRAQYQYVWLNDRPLYLMGILDQGYNPFGIYTYRDASGQGEMKRGSIAWDVDRTMAYGYNMARMHIKENEPLWYYECDRRGLPVWTEHPGNFYATPDDPDWLTAYARELAGMAERLNNHPSILVVSSINESWGVMGGHVMSPWTDESRIRFLEQAADRVRALMPQVLVCDNSGFGKTGHGNLNDFHYYPNEYGAAEAKWQEVLSGCYPGSTMNHFNAANGPHHRGDAVQHGEPLLISEFLHVGDIDLQLRQHEKIAGYLRMNIGSHEVENSAPLTAERWERDYGFEDHTGIPQGYDYVNRPDMVVIGRTRLSRVHAGERIELPVSVSHLGPCGRGQVTLHWTLNGIDSAGRVLRGLVSGEREIAFTPWTVRCEQVDVTVPKEITAAQVFCWLTADGQTLCEHDIQLIVTDTPTSSGVSLAPDAWCNLHFDGVRGRCGDGERQMCWFSGAGEASWMVTLPAGMPNGCLVLECASHGTRNAVRVTDERNRPGLVTVLMDGHELGQWTIREDTTDRRGMFSNDLLGGQPFCYFDLGQMGYGDRLCVPLAQSCAEAGQHCLTLRWTAPGFALFGRGTGRFGCGMQFLSEA